MLGSSKTNLFIETHPYSNKTTSDTRFKAHIPRAREGIFQDSDSIAGAEPRQLFVTQPGGLQEPRDVRDLGISIGKHRISHGKHWISIGKSVDTLGDN